MKTILQKLKFEGGALFLGGELHGQFIIVKPEATTVSHIVPDGEPQVFYDRHIVELFGMPFRFFVADIGVDNMQRAVMDIIEAWQEKLGTINAMAPSIGILTFEVLKNRRQPDDDEKDLYRLDVGGASVSQDIVTERDDE